VINVHAKFDVSSSNSFRDMEGVPNFQKYKSRSRDPFPKPFDLILNFLR